MGIKTLIFLFIFLISNICNAKKYLIVGDSYAYVLSKELKKLSKEDNIIFKANARGGTNSSQWVDNKWFIKTLEEHKPTIVLVSLGVNDAGVPYLRKRFKENSIKIVEIAHDKKIGVFWILPPKIFYKTCYIDLGLKESKPDYVFNSRKLSLDLEKDRVHPTYWANIIWAKEIWKELRNFDDI